jgi:hypothetical protein
VGADLCVPPSQSYGGTAGSAPALERRQAAFGCSREEIELLLKPMIAQGHEAVGSMGDDAPPAALSQRARLFTDFFRQRFAQVTNPSVDPYRESSVMSLTTILGGHGSFLDELAPRPARVVLRSPILTARELAQLTALPAFQTATIATVFPVAGGAGAFDARLQTICDDVCAAVERGSALVILTDRGLSAEQAAVPALLAQAKEFALADHSLRTLYLMSGVDRSGRNDFEVGHRRTTQPRTPLR